jgi:CheY-like chemotaxis protein
MVGDLVQQGATGDEIVGVVGQLSRPDVRLPDGDGLELAASLPNPRPLMVALTASVVPSPRDRAAQAGCDGFLEKPFQPRDLQDLLGRLLDGLTAA